MKVNDIVVLNSESTKGLEDLIFERDKHLFRIVGKTDDNYDVRSISADVTLNYHGSQLRLATLKERYLVDGNSVIIDEIEYFVAGIRLISHDNGYYDTKDIDDNLKFYNGVDLIDEVRKLSNLILNGKTIWERKPKIELTDDEKVILRNIDEKFIKIYRLENNDLKLLTCNGMVFNSHYNHLFKSITHESGVH